MKKLICLYIAGLSFLVSLPCSAQDTLLFEGQLSSWLNYNPNNDLPLGLGIRYIPQLNYHIDLPDDKLIDFEASANIYGATGIHFFDTAHVDGSIKPFRLWARYSTRQLEVRLGLQKINFGSASMLRPLMWFDQIDPRDPLQLTDGVWGLLGRYYFLNNANLWVWGLYGNDRLKTWELAKTNQKYPEFGGRFQHPVPKGEGALTFHHRVADTHGLNDTIPELTKVGENRLGLDGKWDLGVGVWFEGAWISKNRNVGILTHQEIFTVGMDYTFGIGNGLNIIFEQLLISYDEKAFAFSNTTAFSALSLSYPLSMVDNLSAIVYYDATNNALYNFINWKRQFNNIALYFMAYWNPETYRIPQQQDAGSTFSGRGIQIMMVFNH